MTNRNLIKINFAIVSYFILMWLINFFNIDFVLIGVLTEMLTIPFLLAQVVFLVFGLNYLFRNKSSLLTIASVVALFICTITTIGSLF